MKNNEINFFKEYVGQRNIKSNLKTFINSAIKRKTVLDHIFIYGQSGMGKTKLAKIIAKSLNSKIKIVYANNFKKQADLFSCVSKMKPKDILFIDEIHSLNKNLEEFMFPILEQRIIPIMIGKNYNAKVVNINLEHFTIIVATTELHKVNEQLLNRFPIFLTLNHYNQEEIANILINSFFKKNLKISLENALFLSSYCKSNPRVANNLVKRIYDYCIVDDISLIDKRYLLKILKILNIFNDGINNLDKTYLKLLNNGPLGLKTIQQLTNYPLNMIVNKIEPNLLKYGYIIKNKKGRLLTKKGYKFINKC